MAEDLQEFEEMKLEECSLFSPVIVNQTNVQDSKDFDVMVIGGGSGGLACAKECKAISPGAKVALCDYVDPTSQGTSWGIGGTCVNVGCIPKKLMHFAAKVGEIQKDQRECGWNIPEKVGHDWNKMVHNVQSHIRRINWGYHVQLETMGVTYFNMRAKFVDPHTVQLTDKDGNVVTKTSEKFVIAVGGRPRFPDIEGAKEYGISSDDLFSLNKNPGKTLVVGASYVALECAGFLTGLGYKTSVMVRSILLRGFDQDMAERVGNYMEEHGTQMLKKCVPTKIEKKPSGRLRVYYMDDEKNELFEAFDTVLFAIGRDPSTGFLDVEKAGLKIEKSGKLKTNVFDQTNVSHIYCIGDAAEGRPELTPTAIKAGRILAKRLVSFTIEMMDYENVATVVFTPLEYGTVGLSEVEAKKKYGEENISTFHTAFKPLEWNFLPEHGDNTCYIKQLVELQSRKVVGFHIVAPDAGDITQGVAIAMKCGVTKEIFDQTVGIHPTVGEEVIGLDKTKEENPNAVKTSC